MDHFLDHSLDHDSSRSLATKERYFIHYAGHKIEEQQSSRFVGWSHHRLIYILEGEYHFKNLNGSNHTLRAGSAYLFPDLPVVMASARTRTHYYYLGFDTRFDSDRHLLHRAQSQLSLSECPDDHSYTWIEHLKLSPRDHSPASTILNEGILNFLLYPFIQNIQASHPKEMRFHHLIDKLQSQLHSEWSLELMASELDMNTAYFCAEFSRVMGCPPNRYLNNLRLSNAQRLLAQSELKIKDIAHRVGIEDEKYFSRLFMKKTGSSPKAYRAKEIAALEE